MKPVARDAARFRWHQGDLGDGRAYLALEFPVPPPVDMSDVPPEQLFSGGTKFVLAPHFAAIVTDPKGAALYILGQAPMGGGTTLRQVLPEGANCNLGPGPEPTLGAFLDAVRGRAARAAGEHDS